VELKAHPWLLVSQQKVAPVPILHGTNQDEGASFFTTVPHDVGNAQVEAFASKAIGSVYWPKIRELYLTNYSLPCPPPEKYSAGYCAIVRMFGDMEFGCPARHATHALTHNQRQPVWLYYFAPVLNKYRIKFIKHTLEIPFVFQNLDSVLPFVPSPVEELSDVLASYWLNFIRDKDPNGYNFRSAQRLVTWPEDDGSDAGVAMYLDLLDSPGRGVRVVQGLKQHECSFMDQRLISNIPGANGTSHHGEASDAADDTEATTDTMSVWMSLPIALIGIIGCAAFTMYNVQQQSKHEPAGTVPMQRLSTDQNYDDDVD